MSAHTKIITLSERFSTGEPTAQLVSTWGRDGRLLRESTSLTKTAAHSPAELYIRSVEPRPGRSIVLIIGLGDHETYGPNRNGDGFPSCPVHGKIKADEVLTKHYKSYEKAHVFEHHANSDPLKAVGEVLQAFWNPFMRRVEVIEDFDHKKAPHLLERLSSGDPMAKSMGCRIKYDVCTACGNRARTRAEYCDHLKYEMGKIASDTGIQYAALNPSPNFFDSSWVTRPADRTGYMLKKVARDAVYDVRLGSFELGELSDDLAAKSAALRKAGAIEKVLAGKPTASVSSLDKKDARLIERYSKTCPCKNSPDEDDKTVRLMLTYSPPEALGSAEAAGLPLGLDALLKYFLGKIAPGHASPCKATVKSASQHVGLVYELFAEYPRFYDQVVKLGRVDSPKPRADLTEKLAATFAPNSITQDYLYRNVVPEPFRGNARGLTDRVTMRDPATGRQYVTSYGTVQRTHDAVARHALGRKAVETGTGVALVGGGLLLGAGAMASSLKNKHLTRNKAIAMLAGAGAAYGGAHLATKPVTTPGPQMRTEQGERISGWTETMPTMAPELQYTRKRASDSGRATLSDEYTAEFLAQIKHAAVYDDLAPILGPTLDLDKTALALGNSILLCSETR